MGWVLNSLGPLQFLTAVGFISRCFIMCLQKVKSDNLSGLDLALFSLCGAAVSGVVTMLSPFASSSVDFPAGFRMKIVLSPSQSSDFSLLDLRCDMEWRSLVCRSLTIVMLRCM